MVDCEPASIVNSTEWGRSNRNNIKAWKVIGRNKRGATTLRFQLEGELIFFAKLSFEQNREDLSLVAERHLWLVEQGILSPPVIEYAVVSGCQVLITQGIEGETVLSAAKRSFDAALAALGRGLRELHSVPVERCPFVSSPVEPEQSPDRIVVHGDPALVNAIVGKGNKITFVDCGDVGVGNRYLDFAAVDKSIAMNFPGREMTAFLHGYGLTSLDWPKLKRFREIYDNL